MGHIAGELLFTLDAHLNRVEQIIKRPGKGIDLILSLAQTDTGGQIMLPLNAAHRSCDPVHRIERLPAQEVAAHGADHDERRQKQQRHAQRIAEVLLRVAD